MPSIESELFGTDPKLGTDFDNRTKGNRLGDFEVGQEALILVCLDLQKPRV